MQRGAVCEAEHKHGKCVAILFVGSGLCTRHAQKRTSTSCSEERTGTQTCHLSLDNRVRERRAVAHKRCGAVAVHQARVDGAAWIGHIDTDELLYPASSPDYSMHQVLDTVPMNVRFSLEIVS